MPGGRCYLTEHVGGTARNGSEKCSTPRHRERDWNLVMSGSAVLKGIEGTWDYTCVRWWFGLFDTTDHPSSSVL